MFKPRITRIHTDKKRRQFSCGLSYIPSNYNYSTADLLYWQWLSPLPLLFILPILLIRGFFSLVATVARFFNIEILNRVQYLKKHPVFFEVNEKKHSFFLGPSLFVRWPWRDGLWRRVFFSFIWVIF